MGKILFSDQYIREISSDWNEDTSRLTQKQSDLLFYIFEYITKAFRDDFDMIRKDIDKDVVIDYRVAFPRQLLVMIHYAERHHTTISFNDTDIDNFMKNNPDINRSFLYVKIRQTIDLPATDTERYSEPGFDCTTLAQKMFMRQVKDFKYLLETDKKFKDWFDSIPVGGDKR